ncbi:metabotropic glutamate receptor 8-like [Amphiura filiformis]|uniref:metabotropic glutamate receptor 8-like n=1 Tax=Amphiura filiformis TaxID=82378 RepID=UPI003B2175FA
MGIKDKWLLLLLWVLSWFDVFIEGILDNDDGNVQLPGNIMLGGLFPVHEGAINGCGQVDQSGYQRLEAMVYALKKINEDDDLLPGIKLGALILDTCDRDTYALEQSMEFVTSTMNTIDLDAFTCPNNSQPTYEPPRPTVAVVGAAGSPVSAMVANILRLFKIPQVSYASTSPDLSDKTRYDYFLRVVPPDSYQAQAIMDIVMELGWKWVATVASAGNYGEKGISAFKNLTRTKDVCIANSEVIPSGATNSTFNEIVDFLNKSKARAVVVFASETDVRWLLAAVKRKNLTQHFVWIGSDDWGTKLSPVEHFMPEAEGAITVIPAKIPDRGFDEYFTSLKPKPNNGSSPKWFQQYWEKTFHCLFETNDRLQLASDHISDVPSSICTGKEVHTNITYEQEGKIAFVVDATYTLAHALDRLQKHICNGSEGICPEFHTLRGEQYLDYIKNTTFRGSSGVVRFNNLGDRPGSYDLYQYQRFGNTFRYVSIGNWTDRNRLSLNLEYVKWGEKDADGTGVQSVCAEPCTAPGTRRQIVLTGTGDQAGTECCWVCDSCERNQILIDNYTCANCTAASKPNESRTGCEEITPEFLEWISPWAITPALLSVLGIISTSFVIIVFMKYNATPIIRASGRELCYVLLFGIFLTFLTSFVLIARPSPLICGLRRLMLGLSNVISYSALYTKTTRVHRIFNHGKRSVQRPKYTSPRSQMVICFCLVSVQLVGAITWLIVVPPNAIKTYPDWDRVILECSITDMSFVISLTYAMLLVALCTLYAFKTRKMPENFNEAKFIAFAMYTTCVVWLAFIPIYMGTSSTDYKIQQTLLCLCMIVSASVTLGCIFVPKVYIVVFAPQKNKKTPGTLIMNSRMQRSTCGSIEGRVNGDSRQHLTSHPTVGPMVSHTTSSEIEARTPESDEVEHVEAEPGHAAGCHV